jgi:hypothetical protein
VPAVVSPNNECARVLELGGDTLLFGVRGRAGRLSDSPDEITERRSRHVDRRRSSSDLQDLSA